MKIKIFAGDTPYATTTEINKFYKENIEIIKINTETVKGRFYMMITYNELIEDKSKK